MIQDPAGDSLVGDEGDDAQAAATITADQDVDLVDALEQGGPIESTGATRIGRRCTERVGILGGRRRGRGRGGFVVVGGGRESGLFAPSPGERGSPSGAGPDSPEVAHEVNAGLGNQGAQAGEEVLRRQHDLASPVGEGALHAIADVARGDSPRVPSRGACR